MSNQTQLISVVIPLFNKEQYTRRALQSVLAQTFQRFEVIVVDDGSTDRGVDSVTEINDPRISVIRQKNAGVSAARNRGAEEAKGALVAFLDADDEWTPDHLHTITRMRTEFPDAGLYACAYCTYLAGGKIVDHRGGVVRPGSEEKMLHNYFRSANSGEAALHISAVAVTKGIFTEVGGFLVGEKLGEDLEFICKVAITYPVAYSDRIGVTYYRDVEDSAVSSNIMVTQLPFVKTARHYLDKGSVDKSMVNDLLDFIAEHQLWLIRRDILAGHSAAARSMLADCHTSRYRMRKMWWSFWSVLPRRVTRTVFNLKEYIKQR